MNTNQKISIAGAIIALASLGYTIYTQKAFKKDIINKFSDTVQIDMQDPMIGLAINVAIDREINRTIAFASNEIVKNARRDIQEEVKSTIDDTFADVKTSVEKELAVQVANIDMRKFKKDVEEKAKEMITEKFDGNLDTLLSDFNGNLQNVAKIYSSIAESLSKKNNSEAIFKIGV